MPGRSDQRSSYFNSKVTPVIQPNNHNPDLSSDDEPTSQVKPYLEESIGNQTSQQFVQQYSIPNTKFKKPVTIYPHSDAKKQSEESATQFKPSVTEVDFYQQRSSKPFEANSQTRSAYKDPVDSGAQYNELATTTKVDRIFRSSLSATYNTKKVPSQMHSSINRGYYHQTPTEKFDKPEIKAPRELDSKESTSHVHSNPKSTYKIPQHRKAKRQSEEFALQIKTQTAEIDFGYSAAHREVHPEVLLGILLYESEITEIQSLYEKKYFTDEMLWNKFQLLLGRKEENQINIIFSIVSQK